MVGIMPSTARAKTNSSFVFVDRVPMVRLQLPFIVRRVVLHQFGNYHFADKIKVLFLLSVD